MPRPEFLAISSRNESRVFVCGPEVQCQWYRMRLLMSESVRYGYLCGTSGTALTDSMAARGCGFEEAAYRLGLCQLDEAGIIHRNKQGVIYDPEMVAFERCWNEQASELQTIQKHRDKDRLRKHNARMSTDIPRTKEPESVYVLTPSFSKDSKESNTSEGVLPNWLPLEAWEEYTKKVRPKLKAPNTPLAFKRLIGQLEELASKGFSPQLILENAILYGWKGFWEPKEIGGHNDPLGRGEREAAATRAEAVRRLGQKSNSR